MFHYPALHHSSLTLFQRPKTETRPLQSSDYHSLPTSCPLMWEEKSWRLIWDAGGPRGKCLRLVHMGSSGGLTHTVAACFKSTALSMSTWKSYAKQMKRKKILNKSKYLGNLITFLRDNFFVFGRIIPDNFPFQTWELLKLFPIVRKSN